MVIEHFEQGRIKDVYRRFRERGRMMPDGLTYRDSWIDVNCSRCFLLLEADDVTELQDWTMSWEDLAHFEIIPVSQSKAFAAGIDKHL